MKKKNKVLAITLSIVLGATTIFGGVTLFNNTVNKIKGTQAAKILLARENMNNASNTFDWKNMFSSNTQAEQDLQTQGEDLQNANIKSIQANNVQATTSTPLTSNMRIKSLNSLLSGNSTNLGELVYDSPAGKVYKNNGEYNFKDISGASYQGLVVESRLADIDFRVEQAAKNINYLKNDLNIVNKWVKDGYSKFYLDVVSNRETLIEYYEDNNGLKFIWVVERETREDSNSVYSLMYTDMQTGKVDNPVYLVYIPNERYEYYYGHDGNSTDYLIAEQDNGYWNVFMPDETSYENVIISDDFTFQSSGEYSAQPDDFGVVSTANLKEDIISNYETGIFMHLSAFNGIKGIIAPEDIAFIDSYDGGEKSYINLKYEGINQLEIRLNNGSTIKDGDEFSYGSNILTISNITFNFFPNPGFADPQYDVAFSLEMSEGLTLKEKLSLFNLFLNDTGLTCKYNLNDIEKNIIKNSEIANSITSFYTWNGYLMNSSQNFKSAENAIFTKINNLFAEYEKVKDAEEVNKFFSAKVAKNQTFAKISGLSLDLAQYSSGKIQVNNVNLTVERNDLLEQNGNYQLQIGLARIDKNGKFLSQNTVNLKSVDTPTSSTYQGKDLALSLSGTYDIPTALEESRYVVVVYAVTANDHIRVSEMKAIAFVDTVTDTIENDVVKISVSTNNENLIVEYSSKLYFNITLSGEINYTSLRRKMMAEVLKHGYPMDNEPIYNSNDEEIIGGTILPGEYKLKFVISTENGPVTGYVICVVTA